MVDPYNPAPEPGPVRICILGFSLNPYPPVHPPTHQLKNFLIFFFLKLDSSTHGGLYLEIALKYKVNKEKR